MIQGALTALVVYKLITLTVLCGVVVLAGLAAWRIVRRRRADQERAE